MGMFSTYARGDLIQYLKSKGYYIKDTESVADLRIAARWHAEAEAYRRSQLVRDVAVNAERMLRETSFELDDTVDEDHDDNEEDDSRTMFMGW